MRAWILRLAVLAALVAAVVVLRKTVFAPAPPAVTVAAVERGPVEDTVANTKAGTVRARRRAKLSPGTSGLVVERRVERGQRVAAGDLLLRLDDRTPRAQVLLAERALSVAEARQGRACIAERRALRELERQRQLAADEIVSVDRIDALESAHELAVAECAVAAAEVEHARASIDAARAELEKTTLFAPFDAIVAEVEAELGEWVTPSVPLMAAPDLVDAIDPTSLYVSAPMDEVEAARLAAGLPARVTIDSHPGRSFLGHVVRVAPYVLDVEQQNRTVEVEVELEDTAFAQTLLPGTSADVEVILSTVPDVVQIPVLALFEGDRCFVVREGRIEERALEIGLRNWRVAQVRSGLEAGESVVTHFDADRLEPGQRVAVEGTPER